jgi:hypothetical protein
MKAVLVAVVAGLFVGTATAAGPGSGPAQQHTGAGTREAKASLITLRDLGTPWKATGPGPARLQLCAGFHLSPKGLAEIGAPRRTSPQAQRPFIAQTTSVRPGADPELRREAGARPLRHAVAGATAANRQGRHRVAAVDSDRESPSRLPPTGEREPGTSKEKLKTYFDVVLSRAAE